MARRILHSTGPVVHGASGLSAAFAADGGTVLEFHRERNHDRPNGISGPVHVRDRRTGLVVIVRAPRINSGPHRLICASGAAGIHQDWRLAVRGWTAGASVLEHIRLVFLSRSIAARRPRPRDSRRPLNGPRDLDE